MEGRRRDKILAHLISSSKMLLVVAWAPEVLTLPLHTPSMTPRVRQKDEPHGLVHGPRAQS